MKTLFSLLITSLFIITAQFSHAASFDCAKATSKVEKMICANKELSKLDKQMAELYKKVLQMPPNQSDQRRSFAKEDQQRWLKSRNECQDITCLKKSYESKIAAYKGFIADEDPSLLRHYVAEHGDIDWRKNQLHKIWNKPLCAAFKQYLDSFPLEDNYLGCGLKPSPTFKDFTFPQWQKLDPKKYAEVLKKIDDFGTPGSIDYEKLTAMERVELKLQRKSGYALYMANIDVNNDGKPEIIYRYNSLTCGKPFEEKASPTRPSMVIFNPKNNAVDSDSSKLSYADYLFFYQGKTYSATWGRAMSNTKGDNGISVGVFGHSTQCSFSYPPIKQRTGTK